MTDHAAVTLSTAIDLPLPLWRAAALFAPDECAFLLDSGLDPTRLGRYSYLGGRPSALLTGRRGDSDNLLMDMALQTWRFPDGRATAKPAVHRFSGDPFVALRELLAEYPAASQQADAPPFRSGLVGYFGYATAHAIERLPDTGRDDLNLPDVAFMVVDDVLVQDHREGTVTLHVTGRGPEAAAGATTRTAVWRDQLAALPAMTAGSTPPGATSAVRAHFDREQYKAAVQRCREHILAGDVFEVCLTHRLEMDLPGPALDLYGVLRDINPAPFASYLQLPGFQVVGASPERFLQLDRHGRAESRPIKGTRPRGATPAEDAAIKAELAAAEKDLAENIMIVDLVRNDLGKVCRIGSVTVPELQVVETYATVHQLVSTVHGHLKDEYDALDLVHACFPGGSMTGAPKIEAMKIIDRIEPVKRGVYSGALGFIDGGGAMDLSMVIRTIVCQNGVGTFGVGGAVVADSDPDAEYDETMDKARALIAAVEKLANGGLS
jgi:aminodeoxychorismate synthase component I